MCVEGRRLDRRGRDRENDRAAAQQELVQALTQALMAMHAKLGVNPAGRVDAPTTG